ncbi:hypothetical protein TNCV_366851 [Trichonephila clavipes]|nr:hypothetical protein TNCV_366851 [Trichonephila clavipes]
MAIPLISTSPQFRHGTEGKRNILQPPALVIQPARLSDPLIQRARTPRVLEGYLVASGFEPRPSDLEYDALTTRLPTAQSRILFVEGRFNSID